jgi:hypothetical protein
VLIEGMLAYLAADSGMQATLGTPTTRLDKTTGIFPTLAPDRCPMPYCVAQQVAGEPLQQSFQGTGRLQSTRWRFSAYGFSYKQAKSLAMALRLALDGMYGVLPTGDAVVQGAWLLLEADDAEAIPHGTVFATHVDYNVIYVDTTA